MTSQTGLSATSTFSWIYPAAGVEALAVVRTAARYGERLITHGATLQMLARLRARVFASATQMAPRRLHRFHSGDLLDRVQADIDSLDRVVLAVAVPAVVATIVGAAGLAVLALIRPAFATANAVALAVALAGDLYVGRRGRRTGGELARARAAARARLVEVLDGRMEIATYGAGPGALAELGQRFGATDAPRRRWSAREGAGQLGSDLAAAGAVAAVLANGAGLGARPLSPAILAFAALLTMTMRGSPAASGAGSASPRPTCATPACCCSTSRPRAWTTGRLAPCWKISARPFPAPPSSPPFTTARWTTCRCPRMPRSGWPREESSG
jgi:ATP-binding cassette subfamily C protein CydC